MILCSLYFLVIPFIPFILVKKKILFDFKILNVLSLTFLFGNFIFKADILKQNPI